MRGYRPFVTGIPLYKVPKEIVDAYLSHEAAEAINRAIAARLPNEPTADYLTPGTKVLVYYNTSAQNDPSRYMPAQVVSTTSHAVNSLRSAKDAFIYVEYGDVRVMPSQC